MRRTQLDKLVDAFIIVVAKTLETSMRHKSDREKAVHYWLFEHITWRCKPPSLYRAFIVSYFRWRKRAQNVA